MWKIPCFDQNIKTICDGYTFVQANSKDFDLSQQKRASTCSSQLLFSYPHGDRTFTSSHLIAIVMDFLGNNSENPANIE